MADSAAQAIWRRHLNQVAAAARRWRKAQIASALSRYDRDRDLLALLGGLPPSQAGASQALRAEPRRQRQLRARGAPALAPARIALMYAALIAERRLRLIGPGGIRPRH